MDTVVILKYKSDNNIFDEYVVTDLSNSARAEFVRELFSLELRYPEGLIFSVEEQ